MTVDLRMLEQGHAHCNFCGWDGPVEPRLTAQNRAVWHVYEVHPIAWASVPGLGPVPRDPRPEGPIL